MKRIAIIANKHAGQGEVMKQILAARARLWGRSTEFFFPSTVGELQDRLSALSSDGGAYDAIVLIGGDGTVNQAIRKLSAANPVPLFVFPGGTANDLAAELCLKPDWAQVQALVDRGATTLMDLITVNGVPFSTVAGVGIGASLTTEFNDRRSRSAAFKSLSQRLHSEIYTLLTAKTILFQRNYIHHLHIKSSGFEEKLRTPAVFVCNQARLGGNISVAPNTDNADNRFNVLVVTSRSKTRLLASIAELKRGRVSSDFISFSTDQLTLTDVDGRPITAFGDGETLVSAKKLEFRVRSGGLRVFRDPRSERRSRRGELDS